MKTIIVVSTVVDRLVADSLPDAEVVLFTSIQSLDEYVSSSPLRGDILYITEETFGKAVNSGITLFQSLVQNNAFLRVDAIEVIVDKKSTVDKSVDWIINEFGLDNWVVNRGYLTTEYVTGIITGALKKEFIKPVMSSLYRVRKEDHLKEQRLQSIDLDERIPYEQEQVTEDDLPEIRPVFIPDMGEPANVVTITGNEDVNRTLFSFVVAQYLSGFGKTVIIERDYKYLTLSDIVARSGLDVLTIHVEDLFENPIVQFHKMEKTDKRLICILSRGDVDYSTSIIQNYLFNNVGEHIKFFIQELNFSEVPKASRYLVVINNNVVDILKIINKLPEDYKATASFCAVDTSSVPALAVSDNRQIEILLKDLLNLDNVDVPIFKMTGIKLGDEPLDLRRVLSKVKEGV